jgi:glycine/D-amino acid oxidase-like deaminating enzyme
MPTMVSRREFLAAMGAAVAAPRPHVERLTRNGPAQRVLVIGGGLAGLCTAYELQALGHTATVVEAQMGREAASGPVTFEWPFALTSEERRLGLAGLLRTYVDPEAARVRGMFPQRTVQALSDLDRYTPGAWLRTSPWTGWMQGALESARRVVREING